MVIFGDLIIHIDIPFQYWVSQSLGFLFSKDCVFSLTSATHSHVIFPIPTLYHLNFKCVITEPISYYFQSKSALLVHDSNSIVPSRPTVHCSCHSQSPYVITFLLYSSDFIVPGVFSYLSSLDTHSSLVISLGLMTLNKKSMLIITECLSPPRTLSWIPKSYMHQLSWHLCLDK